MNTLVQEAKDCLSSQGGRMTSERLLILETLEASGGHPTADELYNLIKPHHPDLNLSTVYRTLRWLEQEGLVGSQRFGEGSRQDRFDPSYPAEHHHFVCTKCKQVIEFRDSSVEAIKLGFEQLYGARVDSASIVLNGLCSDCIKKQGRAARRQDFTDSYGEY
jgi:Fe2+ or Zn2+ uptake regulation protein